MTNMEFYLAYVGKKHIFGAEIMIGNREAMA
jgi:hypothetical protein